MSIYSGFATRGQQQHYDQLVQDLIYVLQKRLFKFYEGQLTDESKFFSILSHIQTQMVQMEKNKYLEPKTSHSIDGFLGMLKQHHNYKSHIKEKNFNGTIKNDEALKTSRNKNFIDHRQSFALNSHTSELIGRIKHQFSDHKNINGYTESNPEKIFQKKVRKTNDGFHKRKDTQHSKNSNRSVDDTNYIRPRKISPLEVPEAIREYIDKTNKNYFKCYRKRKLKPQSYNPKNNL